MEVKATIVEKPKSKIFMDWYDYLYEYGFSEFKNTRIYRKTENLEVGFWINKNSKTHYTPTFCVKQKDDISFLYSEAISQPICVSQHKKEYRQHLERYHGRYSILHVKNESDCYKLLVHMIYNNPKVGKEQARYLIDHIKECCEHEVIRKKVKYFAVQKIIFDMNKKYQQIANSIQIKV